MTDAERPKLTLASNNSEITGALSERAFEYEQLAYNHHCAPSEHPRWCIMGHDGKGGKEVFHYIRPSKEDEWVARRIAKYLNDVGRKASVERVEEPEAAQAA